jgi:hypothetical protein
LAKVARDAENVYFYVKTRQPLSPRTDPNWMWLLIDADSNPSTGWEGYDFVVNRSMQADGSWLERNKGAWAWEKVTKAKVRVEGRELMLALPRTKLGLLAEGNLRFDFKWWDNAQQSGDIMDTYLSGDAAPDARFRYRYQVHRVHQ